MQGIEYNQRMEELEKLEYPKPNRDFIYSTFNAFAARHPWVGQENIRPKSIAREMFEEFRSFADYIKIYELQRAEGRAAAASLQRLQGPRANRPRRREERHPARNGTLPLARCSGRSIRACWRSGRKCATRTISRAARRPEVRPPGAEEAARDITRDPKAFTAAIRNRIFTFLRALASGELEAALATVHASPSADEEAWTTERLRRALDAYHVEHERIRLDPEARNLRHTYITPSEDKTTLARAANAGRSRGGQRLGGGVSTWICASPAPARSPCSSFAVLGA